MSKAITIIDKEYTQWVKSLVSRYRQSQIKAAIRVNYEQLKFNWLLGRDIVEMKVEERWGESVIEQLSKDLKSEMPQVEGLSVTNLRYCRRFYLLYSQTATIRPQIEGESIDDTSSIIIEVAHFNSSKIRKTAKRYGFHTEASHRFERGIDGANLEEVCKRIAYLLNHIAKLNSLDTPNIYQIYKVGSCDSSTKIALRMDRIKAILGYRDINQDRVNQDLQSLGF